ncbi:MAG: glycine betaine ABC transporter substrate-binding protein [Microthrixaceae bacterium]
MKLNPRFGRFAVAAAALAMVPLAACGDDNDGGGGDTASADSPLAEADLSGVSIKVGSKDFDEQLILGNILADAYEAAGADVDRKINLGGTNVVREALLAGEIDSYAEYNGTGWTEHLGQEDPSSDGEELTENVRKSIGEKSTSGWGVRRSTTRTAATGPDLTEKNGGPFDFDSMAAYIKDNLDAKVCMESEFPAGPTACPVGRGHGRRRSRRPAGDPRYRSHLHRDPASNCDSPVRSSPPTTHHGPRPHHRRRPKCHDHLQHLDERA